MPEWTIVEDGSAFPNGLDPAVRLEEVERNLAAERELNMILKESYADLEMLYRDDAGWRRIGEEEGQFTLDGRRRITALADLFTTGNALIKRGVKLRTAYVWGQGVTVAVADDGTEGQDVAAVWQDFWDEPSNRREFTAREAQTRYERRLATGGEAFWAFPTDRLTGRVWIRNVPAGEIVDRVCNPEDEAQVWLYKRVWRAVTIDPRTGRRETKDRVTYYPALGFYPAARPDKWGGEEIRWDAPMRHVAVNVPDRDWRGIGDVLAAMPWAKMDKEFLEDLAVYMRALTRLLGQVTSPTGKAREAARAALAQAQPGELAITDPDTKLSLASKSGAQIDGETHRPFATLAAAALEVPVTMLLSDPGVTGARATAETLDQPTELMARDRREVHAELFRDIAGYVIDQAVIARRGPLRGAVTKIGDRIVVTLPEGDSRTVSVDWPEFDSTPLKDRVAAIVEADGTEKLPPVEILKLLARAFELEDVDDLIDQMTDDNGNWLDSRASGGDAAVRQHRRGGDPVDVIDPEPGADPAEEG